MIERAESCLEAVCPTFAHHTANPKLCTGREIKFCAIISTMSRYVSLRY
jgi:hypothetical protein